MPTQELDRAPLRGTIWALAAFLVFSGLWLLGDSLLQRRAMEDETTRLQSLAADYAALLDRDMARRAAHVFGSVHDPALIAGMETPQILPAFVRRLLDADPAYTWIGVLDTKGMVLAATNDLLVGTDSSRRPVFIEGSKAPWIGDVHDALLLAKLIPTTDGEMLRFVDFATPIKDRDNTLLGVLAVHVGWSWARSERDRLLRRREAQHTDLLILSADGSLLLGQPGEIGAKPSSKFIGASTPTSGVERWPDGRQYLVAATPTRGFSDYGGLGWVVLARKPLGRVAGPQEPVRLWIWPALVVVAVGFGTIGWSLALRR